MLPISKGYTIQPKEQQQSSPYDHRNQLSQSSEESIQYSRDYRTTVEKEQLTSD